MKSSLQKSSLIVATAVATLIALTLSNTASAQSQAGPVGDAVTGFLDGFTPAASSYRLADVEAMYEANSKGPLGGFFAKGFTRTFTILGGWNFATSDLPTDIVGTDQSPLTFDLAEPLSLLVTEEDLESKDTGYAISAAMGRRHSRTLRSEIELAIRENNLVGSTGGFVSSNIDVEARAISLMKNVLFELPTQTRFTPYAGVGIGISFVEVEAESRTSASGDLFNSLSTDNEVAEDDTAFTYQFIGGLSTRINQAADFVVEYRFLGTGEIQLDGIGELPYSANNLFLGLKLEY